MKGQGHIIVSLESTETMVFINIIDRGKGITKKLFKKIFETGFTSKKRGWGLGLSLSKRIIEEYHSGKIKVLQSEKEVGTTMQISLKTPTLNILNLHFAIHKCKARPDETHFKIYPVITR